MAPFNPSYNPGQVLMQNPNAGTFGGKLSGPYLGGDGGPRPTSDLRMGGTDSLGSRTAKPGKKPVQNGTAPVGNVLQSETVRATGGGPFDSVYRQNLATYSGGQMARPGGNLSFNPTSNTPFGNPTGGGTDPITGGPNSLTAMALGGEGFGYTAPKPPAPAKGGNMQPDWTDWLTNRSRYGRGI
jgi:hypothetical protein